MAGAASVTTLRWARPADQPAIRAFLEAVGFVVRPPQTWAALDMSAATAWRGERLLGAIPMEPRRLKVGSTRSLRCLQQTTVAVDPALRGRGIGTALQDFIAEQAGEQAEALTVYREEPESAGYRWYCANGFAPIQRLCIWSRAPGPSPAAPDLRVAAWDDPAVPLAEIEALRRRVSAAGNGLYIPRENRSLADWLPVHPYARAWRFEIAWSTRPLTYALLGRRPEGGLELLEIGSEAAESGDLAGLVQGLCGFAYSRGERLRCMLADSDEEAIAAVQAAGFARVSSMDLLMKPLGAGGSPAFHAADRARWRHYAIDYL